MFLVHRSNCLVNSHCRPYLLPDESASPTWKQILNWKPVLLAKHCGILIFVDDNGLIARCQFDLDSFSPA